MFKHNATLLRISRLPANYKTCFIRLPCCHSKLLVFLEKNEKNFPTFLYAKNKKKYCRESDHAIKSVVFTTTTTFSKWSKNLDTPVWWYWLPEVESSRTSRPRGQILKSLALASRPQVLENWPVLGSRTALFFWIVKILWSAWKIFWKTFFVEIAWKNFVKTFFFFFGDRLKNFCEDLFFFGKHLRLCWPRAFLFLAWRVSVLGKAVLGLGLGFFCVLGLEPCVLDSTSADCTSLQQPCMRISFGLFWYDEFFCNQTQWCTT